MSAPPEIIHAVRAAQSIVCATHSPMDGDGIGCGLALKTALERTGKQFVFLTEAPIPRVYDFLPGYEDIEQLGDGPPPQGDLLLGVDAGEADRLGRMYLERPAGMMAMNIDHHISNTRFGDLNWVDPTAAATGEQIFLLLRELGLEIDARIAQYLLVSLVTDTGRFCYSSTTPRTLEIAAELVRCGGSPDQIQAELYASTPVAVLRLRGRAIEDVQFHAEGAVALLTVDHHYGDAFGVDEDAVKDLIDVAIGVRGVVVAALVRGLAGGGTKVSLRSKDDRADVAALAQRNGGGGHVRASGFTGADGPSETAARLLPQMEALVVALSR